MKFIKLSIFALSMGLFIASCGNGENADGTAEDTTVVAPAAETTPMEPAAPTTDTPMAAPATTDSAAHTPASH